MSVYTTPASLRVMLGVDQAALPDAVADDLIDAAEDTIDRIIGAGGPVNPATGRAITPAHLAAWRRGKLAKATLLLAALEHTTPGAFLEQIHGGTVKGPDFEISGETTPRVSPAGQAALRRAANLLDSASLRRLTARTTA